MGITKIKRSLLHWVNNSQILSMFFAMTMEKVKQSNLLLTMKPDKMKLPTALKESFAQISFKELCELGVVQATEFLYVGQVSQS
jgi:hypothetical protein